jgi:hypothetical protein
MSSMYIQITMINKYTIAQFIPILFTFFAAGYTQDFIKFITSFLGKLISVFVIVFYSTMNKYYGLLSAAIVVYIQHMLISDNVYEGFGKDDFIQKHCDNGKLKYKGSHVNYEMAEHVFPEITYNYKEHRCNPCDTACAYTITEEKMRLEEDIIWPKSNDKKAEPSILDYWLKPIASIGVFSEPFSYI